ncbi:hypothetical protein EsHS_00004216 [Epichloe bromicola]
MSSLPMPSQTRYVRDILTNTSKDLETVTIEPDGRWLTKMTPDDSQQSPNIAAFADDDDLEISEISVVSGRLETPKPPKTHTPIIGTPASVGRDSTASAPRGAGTYSTKRPAAAVIDLTLSSDDDELAQRPQKRQNMSANSYRDPNGMKFLSESPNGYQPS